MIRDPRIMNRMSLIETVLFTSSTTYRVPANARLILVEGLGGGGGGGGGARVSTATSVGAGGGGGGAPFAQIMMVATPGSAITVTIGAGGAGGLGRTGSNGDGTDGSTGGSSRFNNFYFPGGRAGLKGTTTGNGLGGAGYVDIFQGRNRNGNNASEQAEQSYSGYGGGVTYYAAGGGSSYLGGGGGARGFSADVYDDLPYSGGLSSTSWNNMGWPNGSDWYVPEGATSNGPTGVVSGRDGGYTEGNGGTGGGGGGGSGRQNFNGTNGGSGGNGEIRIWVFG